MKPKPNDCIAYVCVDFDKEKTQYLLNNETKPELKEIMGRIVDAFSIDTLGDNTELDSVVIESLPSQTGYSISNDEIGRIFNVGIIQHCNGDDSFCFLFIVNVTGLTQNEELISDTVKNDLIWCGAIDVMILNSWKPMCILKKAEFISQQKQNKIENES
jgi:hypothetical protein